MIPAKNEKKEFEMIPEGAYPARIYQIVHVGTIAGYNGLLQNKVRLTFELPTELKVFDEKKGEQPCVISKEYTLSFNEKANLRKVIDACDPKALKADDNGLIDLYDVENLLGKSCLITVSHVSKKDGTGEYQDVSNVTKLPKGME